MISKGQNGRQRHLKIIGIKGRSNGDLKGETLWRNPSMLRHFYAVSPGGVSEGHSADEERVNIRNGHSASFKGYTAYADDERQERFCRVARAYGGSHYPAR